MGKASRKKRESKGPTCAKCNRKERVQGSAFCYHCRLQNEQAKEVRRRTPDQKLHLPKRWYAYAAALEELDRHDELETWILHDS